MWLCLPWPTGCSEQVEVHTERRGVIYSPSWPLNYPAGVNCSWHIQGGQGEVITIRYTHTHTESERAAILVCLKQPTFSLSFRNFDVAESESCSGDWLVLIPSWKGDSRLCGSVLPPPFFSTRGHVWLYFHSQTNSLGQAQGFLLAYTRGKA